MNARIVNVQQGSDEWLRHRSAHFSASDAASVLGTSPYRSRAELLREKATGIAPDVDDATARRFALGHEYEATARPWAEEIIGCDLYPIVLAADVEGLPLSASFDGVDMLQTVTFEHKTGRADLLASLERGEIPEQYHPQLEQGLLLSGAERCLFMASCGNRESMRFAWYEPNQELRAKLIAAWLQFAADVAAYEPEPAAAPVPVARPVEGFGVLSLRVEGRVLASNLDAFRAGADAFIARLPKASELETDQDFADAEAAVKACGEAESRIKAAKDAALAQKDDVDAVLRAADAVAETIRAAQLALEKVVKAEKENRRAAIVSAGVQSVLAHYTSINATLGEYSIGAPASLSSELGAAIKGKRTISSITDAVDAAVANAKIEASQQADKVRASIVVLDEHQDALHLLPDRVALAHSLTPDVLRSVIRDRLDDARAKEAARIERIRAEELAKAEKESVPVGLSTHDPARVNPSFLPGNHIPARSTVKLGQINAAIRPLSITAEGLSSLGFHPVGTERAAKLYDASQFDAMRAAMIALLESADRPRQVAA